MKMWKRIRGKAVGLLFGILLGVICIPQTARAYTRIDTEQETSLTLQYAFEHVEFRMYRVADISETARYTLTDSFAKYPIELSETDSEGWRSLAVTLDGYVQRDQIEPLVQGRTDAAGMLQFTGLRTGLYLVVGEAFASGNYEYAPTTFLLSLPELTENDVWDYHPTVLPKDEQEAKKTQYRAVKIWKDTGYEKKRPEKITAQLLKDGKIYDEAVLNEENGWQYTWSDLDVTSRWTVTEKEADKNYTVLVSKEGTSFLITNRYKPAIPGKPGGNTSSKLPQTGQLWWPVTVLALAGVLLVIVGICIRKNKE